MKSLVYIATSLDGFIATEDGGVDWLPTPSDNNDEDDFGYQKFIGGISAIVLGRNSFEKVLEFPEFPYSDLSLIVIVTRNPNFKIDPKNLKTKDVDLLISKIHVLACPIHPQDVIDFCKKKLKERNDVEGNINLEGDAYIDGGQLIQWFFRHNSIQEMTLARIPVLLTRGIPLFEINPPKESSDNSIDIKYFKHCETTVISNGIVMSKYIKGDK